VRTIGLETTKELKDYGVRVNRLVDDFKKQTHFQLSNNTKVPT